MIGGIVVHGFCVIGEVVRERGTLKAQVVEVVAGEVGRVRRGGRGVARLDGIIGVVKVVLGRVACEIETSER
jgi:hypothetical protein